MSLSLQLIHSITDITKNYLPKGVENITNFENSHNMTEFVLKKIKKTHGHFNKDYIMGFSALEGLRNSPVSIDKLFLEFVFVDLGKR